MRKIVEIARFDCPLQTRTDMALARVTLEKLAESDNIKADGFLISTTTGKAYFFREER